MSHRAGESVEYAVTFLEMEGRPSYPRPQMPHGPTSVLVVAEAPPVWYFLSLYDAVGAEYEWTDQHLRPRDELDAFLKDPAVVLYTLMRAGWPHGFFVLDGRARGVFNVAGPQPLPLSVIIRQAQRQPVPLPMMVLRQLIGRFGLPRLPPGALYHLQYPIVVDARAFREATGFTSRFDEVQTIESFLQAHPPPRPRREELFDRREALGVLK